jgi:Acetyltransferase (GNAT) domain
MEPTGYLNPLYAQSLSGFGYPRLLPESRGWVLERAIPGYEARDAMGCYPLFACRDWSRLSLDLSALEGDLVSLVIVTDPFGDYTLADLDECFTRVIPFKEHYVVGLSQPSEAAVSKHHRYYAKKSLQKVTVEACADPLQFLDDWVDLYGELTQRHQLTGIHAFSREAFEKQLIVPGLTMLRAVYEGETVGAHLWYVQADVAYSHLAAYSPAGYQLMASYALYWSALDYFANRAKWLDLGAGTGTKNDTTDGLAEFKRGWTKDTRTVYICGRILNPEKYEMITAGEGISATEYFPAYRRGEFGG